MASRTSQIVRRVRQAVDGDVRQLRARLMCDYLTADSHRHDLGLTFLPNARGEAMAFEHWPYATEYASRRADTFTGRFLAFLARECGTSAGSEAFNDRLAALATIERAALNSRIRGDLRAIDKNLSTRQRRQRDQSTEIELMFSEFSDWRWPEKS